jgi:hypothetical protein
LCSSKLVIESNTCTACPSGHVQNPSDSFSCVIRAGCTDLTSFYDCSTNACSICPTGEVQDPNLDTACIPQTVCDVTSSTY